MTARVWTREELDRVHPLPVGWTWEYDRQTGWFARGPRKSSVCIDPDSGSVVAVINGPLYTDHFPPQDIALAVILASKGLDSLGAMADAVDYELATLPPIGVIGSSSHLALRRIAAMLRRGTVAP